MTLSDTLPCGCYVGPWWSISPPPKCAAHADPPLATQTITTSGTTITIPSTTVPGTPAVPSSPAPLQGWQCPVCRRGLSPFTTSCPCVPQNTWPVTPWTLPMAPPWPTDKDYWWTWQKDGVTFGGRLLEGVFATCDNGDA